MTQQRQVAPPDASTRTPFAPVGWRKSSYSGDTGNCVEAAVLGSARWHKSSYSGSEGNCIEVANDLPDAVAVRDSKAPGDPALVFSGQAWTAFVARVRRGEVTCP